MREQPPAGTAGIQGRKRLGAGLEQAGAVWALTRLHTASLAPELTPCQATRKGDFRPLWEIGLLGEMGSLDLLWGNVELEQDAGGFAGPRVCMSRVGERTPRWMWGLWEKSFPLRLPLLFLRDSPHCLEPAVLLMAGAGEVTDLGRRLERRSLRLPFLPYTFPCSCPTTPCLPGHWNKTLLAPCNSC